MEHPVVHFEILGASEQKQALQDFYAQTFGWKFSATGPMEYGLVDWQPGDPGIGGAVDVSDDGQARVVISIGVDNIRDFVEKARANGTEIVQDVHTVPGMVTFATFRDPAGNLVGVVDNEMPPEE